MQVLGGCRWVVTEPFAGSCASPAEQRSAERSTTNLLAVLVVGGSLIITGGRDCHEAGHDGDGRQY